ncbi:hypothetical protein EXIGLDRAFT_100933 [Exidia glandulosa HHB12029]|uniref:Uncharacterized protein n=1 Tax=Exidia glandulosa HHB12029 TaxID=1314781 RepID=A0A165NS08_EXIGL|nr:hypothetical protein EXIGLDRAFT_100933 [Exidia glandulosa HHB12029]
MLRVCLSSLRSSFQPGHMYSRPTSEIVPSEETMPAPLPLLPNGHRPNTAAGVHDLHKQRQSPFLQVEPASDRCGCTRTSSGRVVRPSLSRSGVRLWAREFLFCMIHISLPTSKNVLVSHALRILGDVGTRLSV